MLCPHTAAVNRSTSKCQEHMICPLSRANDLTAPRGPRGWDSHRGGGDELHPGGRGACHERAGSHLACVEWTAIVVAGGRGAGGECADGTAAPAAVSARDTGSRLAPADLLFKRTGQGQPTETQKNLSAGDSQDHE